MGKLSDTGANGLDEQLGTLKENVKSFVDDGSQKIKTRVVEVRDQAMNRGQAMLGRATETIRANPLKAVGIAFGIGYLGMRLFRR